MSGIIVSRQQNQVNTLSFSHPHARGNEMLFFLSIWKVYSAKKEKNKRPKRKASHFYRFRRVCYPYLPALCQTRVSTAPIVRGCPALIYHHTNIALERYEVALRPKPTLSPLLLACAGSTGERPPVSLSVCAVASQRYGVSLVGLLSGVFSIYYYLSLDIVGEVFFSLSLLLL